MPSASCTTLDAAVGRVDRRLGEAVGVGDERLADAQRQHRAVRARADLAGAVVGLGRRVLVLAGAVSVLDVVVGVVVVVDEVPAGDVVGVAVVVVVDAVGEGDDQVLGREHPGRAVAACARRRRVRALRVGLDDVRHARVAGVVERVEDALSDRRRRGSARCRRVSPPGMPPCGVVVAAGAGVRRRAVDAGRGVERLASGRLSAPGSSPALSSTFLRSCSMSPASFHLMPESSSPIETSGRPSVTSKAGLAPGVPAAMHEPVPDGNVACASTRLMPVTPHSSSCWELFCVIAWSFGRVRFFDGGVAGRGRELPAEAAEVGRDVPRRERPARRVAGRPVADVGEVGERLRRPAADTSASAASAARPDDRLEQILARAPRAPRTPRRSWSGRLVWRSRTTTYRGSVWSARRPAGRSGGSGTGTAAPRSPLALVEAVHVEAARLRVFGACAVAVDLLRRDRQRFRAASSAAPGGTLPASRRRSRAASRRRSASLPAPFAASRSRRSLLT